MRTSLVQPETLLRWHRQGCAPVLEVQVQSSIFQTKDTRRNHGFDQGNGGAESACCELNGSVAHDSSWASASANALCKSTSGILAHQDGEDRTGPPSCRIMPKTSGRVIACRSQTSSFAHCLPSSLSMCTLVKSSMWVSTHLYDLLPTPGPPIPLREAIPCRQSPNCLMRDRDNKFGSCFARVATTSGITMLTTLYHAPRANAICERFLGSVRRGCLDHLFIFQEKQLHRVLHASVQSFNRARLHQTTDSRTVW
jgi:hypothetical protein